jgi:hypothetical protein
MDYEIGIKLDELLRLAKKSLQQETHMTVEIDALKVKLAALEAGVDSLIDLAKTLAADFASAKEDPVEIQAIADSVQGELDKVTAAIAADTPPAVPVQAPPAEG